MSLQCDPDDLFKITTGKGKQVELHPSLTAITTITKI